ncbi:hypothetical protein, partial [Photobacterium sp. OFAV2-7]|uniref:hypothetical protein n=1 Tax=Photobacterium sp. OFAV2-7 TaxID=2917748 RepID=UPI001EF66557
TGVGKKASIILPSRFLVAVPRASEKLAISDRSPCKSFELCAAMQADCIRLETIIMTVGMILKGGADNQ